MKSVVYEYEKRGKKMHNVEIIRTGGCASQILSARHITCSIGIEISTPIESNMAEKDATTLDEVFLWYQENEWMPFIDGQVA